MSISLKNRFRPTLDALEDRFMPSAVGTGLIHHRPHHGHVQHRPGRTIEVHHHGAGEQEMHTGADDNGGTGVPGADDNGGGRHGGGHA